MFGCSRSGELSPSEAADCWWTPGLSPGMVDANIQPLSIQDRLCVVKNHTLHEVDLFTQNTADLKE